MNTKNKSIATLLGLLAGTVGLHRFYLFGMHDRWAWLHAASLPASLLLLATDSSRPLLVNAAPLVASALAACLGTFLIGLTPDEQWQTRHGTSAASGWPLALMLVLNLASGATLLLTVLARSIDLALTGGAYG